MDNCKICTGDFEKSPDSLVLCDNHKGFVHFGCCTHRCSHDDKPCKHCIGQYTKVKV
jgi:hypothetical protein